MLTSWKKPFFPWILRAGKRKESKHFSEPPVLIGGCGRSGTTLLLSMLSASPRLFCVPRELGLFNEVLREENGEPYPSRIDRLYFNLLKHRIPPTADRWCEKSPSNVREIETIDRHFGGRFRFIHIIRDGRDVTLSNHPTDPSRYWVSPGRWVRDVRKGLAFREHPNVHTLFYEDLIRDYGRSMRSICDFIEIEYAPQLEDWHRFATVRNNSAYFGRVKKLSSRSVGKWRTTADKARLEAFYAEPGARALLEELGYDS